MRSRDETNGGLSFGSRFFKKTLLVILKAVGLEKPALPAHTLRQRQAQRLDTFSAEPSGLLFLSEFDYTGW